VLGGGEDGRGRRPGRVRASGRPARSSPQGSAAGCGGIRRGPGLATGRLGGTRGIDIVSRRGRRGGLEQHCQEAGDSSVVPGTAPTASGEGGDRGCPRDGIRGRVNTPSWERRRHPEEDGAPVLETPQGREGVIGREQGVHGHDEAASARAEANAPCLTISSEPRTAGVGSWTTDPVSVGRRRQGGW